ncbi:hypothetical protein Ddye_011748 [Dipteronia dyeriana]|uniref:Reverse transcriptase zinc-binding domain-containing protein n=1 Tax=Dipteronia dyeriana TaxID=168575 RepID=A0AAD9X379_9ROSI|nr:hypothetical protein Ddye_011748 [Dipteronia dyeriana]
MEESPTVGSLVLNLVWQGVCLPNIEIFGWQLLRGRVMVKNVMQHFGLYPTPTLLCSWCNEDEETIDHLFIHCRWWWKLWTSSSEEGSKVPISTMLLNIKDSCSAQNFMKNHHPTVWIPHNCGALKFNVNGSARGSPVALVSCFYVLPVLGLVEVSSRACLMQQQ